MEGIEDYYVQHVMWGTTNLVKGSDDGMPPEIKKRPIRTAAINSQGEKIDLGVFDEEGNFDDFQQL